jgi:L-amino acid N-acyltransferase YncA
MNLKFKPITANDWNSIATIYKQGIETGDATFEQDVPSWEDWDASHIEKCRIATILENQIVGWAALTQVSGRCIYAGVAEVSVYVHENFRGKKIGLQLLQKIIEESEKENFWSLQSGIFPENKASLSIHDQAGFRIIGIREKIGKMNGKWRNNTILERRSTIIGVE